MKYLCHTISKHDTMRTNSISLCSCKTQYNIKKAWILALLTGLMVAACHPKPHNVRQAGRDALESARIQLDSGNKAEALQLFKDAEHYSLLANDTLTVAYARYNIARCLGYYADKQETVSLLRSAAEGFSDDYANRAEALRELGDFYQIHSQFDSAEYYLEQAIVYAEQSGSTKAKRDVLSAFHTMYFNAGDYEKSADYLSQFWQTSITDADDNLLMYYYHDMGNIYYACGYLDSADYYYGRLEELVTHADPNEDTWFYYGVLSDYAEECGDYETACKYGCLYEEGNNLREIEQQENNLALISHKYDSEVMRNELNRKIIIKQRIIVIVSLVATLVLAALLVSQIRLARRRKREAEINAELFHFKQQNKDLAQKHAEHEQIQQDYADRLSEALMKEQRIMLLLDNYLNSNKKANLLKDLETSVYDDKDHWEAMLEVIDQLYPDLTATLQQKYPDLDEDEKKSYILSYFKLSRQEEADYLGTTVNMVDKLRGRRRKKMEEG
jgi:tetratricopeptide (TPR) repeat protein